MPERRAAYLRVRLAVVAAAATCGFLSMLWRCGVFSVYLRARLKDECVSWGKRETRRGVFVVLSPSGRVLLLRWTCLVACGVVEDLRPVQSRLSVLRPSWCRCWFSLLGREASASQGNGRAASFLLTLKKNSDDHFLTHTSTHGVRSYRDGKKRFHFSAWILRGVDIK